VMLIVSGKIFLLKYKNMSALYFNGGKESLIILHKYMHRSMVVYIESDDEFVEIGEYIDKIVKLYNLKLMIFKDMKTSIVELKKLGIDMVIIGSRRTDPDCEKLNTYQYTDEDWPKIMRFHPLLDWSYSDVWDYIEEHKLPICSLYERGYTSLGSRSRTFPNNMLFTANGYLHAKYLSDHDKERDGRISTSLPLQITAKIIGRSGDLYSLQISENIDKGVYYAGNMLFMCDDSKNILFCAQYYEDVITFEITTFIRKIEFYDSYSISFKNCSLSRLPNEKINLS
jgi:FAD synthetase